LLNLLENFFVILSLSFDFFLQLLSLSDLTFHQRSVLVHDLSNVDIMGLNDVSNSFLEVSRLFFLFSLKFLEFGCVLQHLLGVLISIVLKLSLVIFGKIFDSLFKGVLFVPLVLVK